MKRLIYFIFLAALLSSCGPSHPLNYAKIEFRDAKWESYYLLSMHDSDIAATRVVQPNDSIEIIPFRNIDRIFLQGSTSGGEWLGFLGGTAIGIGVNEVVATPYEKSHGSGEGGGILVPFIPIGVFIGNALTDKLYEIDLNSPGGQEQLHRMLKYRNIK